MLIFALSKNKTYTEGKSMIFSVLIVFLIVEEFSKNHYPGNCNYLSMQHLIATVFSIVVFARICECLTHIVNTVTLVCKFCTVM